MLIPVYALKALNTLLFPSEHHVCRAESAALRGLPRSFLLSFPLKTMIPVCVWSKICCRRDLCGPGIRE